MASSCHPARLATARPPARLNLTGTLQSCPALATGGPEAGPARRPARLLRRRRPRRADGRARARAPRRPGLRAQGDRPQQARGRGAGQARARSSSSRRPRCRRARSSSSPPTALRPAVHDNAAARNLRTIDATCPLVTKVHVSARRFAAEGYTIVMIGHEGHEEVEGTTGEAPESIVLIETADEVESLEVADPDKVAFITQTTLSVDETAEVIAALRAKFPGDRQLQVRRHLLRDDQPPDRGQAARPRVRPGPGDRLDQLLQLQPPGRGRARTRRRLPPDRQPHPGRGGVAGGGRDGRHHLRRQRPRGAGREPGRASSASAAPRTSPSCAPSTRTSASCCRRRSGKRLPPRHRRRALLLRDAGAEAHGPDSEARRGIQGQVMALMALVLSKRVEACTVDIELVLIGRRQWSLRACRCPRRLRRRRRPRSRAPARRRSRAAPRSRRGRARRWGA